MLSALGVDAVAERVYRELLASPGQDVPELCTALDLPEAEIRRGLDLLASLSLVRDSMEQPGRAHAVSPDVGLQAAVDREQASLARHRQRLEESQIAVWQLITERARDATGSAAGEVEQLLGMDAVADRLERLARVVTSEVATIMPGGAQPSAALRAARSNDVRLLERGISIRTVGLDSIRDDPATAEYARFLSRHGGSFRTAQLLPPRMILADRQVALVPIDPEDSHRGALYLTGPGTVAALTALFAQVWESATPFSAEYPVSRDDLSSQEAALLRLLAQGLTDQAVATRLGVSARTARRMMADLMDRLGASSRFEAGMKAAQLGWL